MANPNEQDSVSYDVAKFAKDHPVATAFGIGGVALLAFWSLPKVAFAAAAGIATGAVYVGTEIWANEKVNNRETSRRTKAV